MSRYTLTITDKASRDKAALWLSRAPVGMRVTFQEARRSVDQNDLMWSLLGEVSIQARHHGQKLSPEDWKVLFMAGLSTELRIVPNLDGSGFIPLGRSSSKLSKDEMSQLIELIMAWGAQNGVTFSTKEIAA